MSTSINKNLPTIPNNIDWNGLFISDFDETILKLDIAWNEWRKKLKVKKISDLWDQPNSQELWQLLLEAEVQAADRGDFIPHTIDFLEKTQAFAVLTNNGEPAVERALSRIPQLKEKCLIIIGRETLGGPKQERKNFAAGFNKCLDVLPLSKKDSRVYYLGDQDYELEFAQSLKAQPICVNKNGLEFR